MNPAVGRFSPVHYWQWTGKGYASYPIGCRAKQEEGTLATGVVRNGERVHLMNDGVHCETAKGFDWHQMG